MMIFVMRAKMILLFEPSPVPLVDIHVTPKGLSRFEVSCAKGARVRSLRPHAPTK